VILSGNRDSVVYEELHSGGLARDIPGARLIWLDGVGHMPQHAATETAVAAIEEVANLARGRALALR
jgi:pimeloyl-ACP methyl ester carboxylesterase